jgi:hypothetical protein
MESLNVGLGSERSISNGPGARDGEMSQVQEESPGSRAALREVATPIPTASDEFCRHFFKCFFCHIGDRYTDDHFCETGRELIVAMLDEMDGRP